MTRPASTSPTPHSSARPDALPSALARAYARALERYQKKRMADGPPPEPDGRDEAKGVQDDRPSRRILPS